MSRTYRTRPTNGNYREARQGAIHARTVWQGVPYFRSLHGGMLMSPRQSRMWSDDYMPSGRGVQAAGDVVKRAKKRRERRIKMKEALDA